MALEGMVLSRGRLRAEMKTIWECERCGSEGVVHHDTHIDVWQMVQAIEFAHDEEEPGCGFDINRIKVKFEASKEAPG